MVAENAWEVYQRILLSLLQENRGNAREIYDQFKYYKTIGWRLNKKALKEALDRIPTNKRCYTELSWAVYGYLTFNINLSKNLAERILYRGDIHIKSNSFKIIIDRGLSQSSH